MSHAQIFLSVVSPTSHFSSSCWNSNQIRGEEELKSQVKPNGKVTEHGRRFCINVWMPFLCVSGLIETRKKKHKAEGKSPRSPSSVRVTSKLSTRKGEKINPDQWREWLRSQNNRERTGRIQILGMS